VRGRALLVDEPDSGRCAELPTAGAHLLITAPWTVVECDRAVRSAWRQARLADVDDAVDSIHQVLATFALVSPPYDHLVPMALQMVERHLLKTLDAIHLAAAVLGTDMTEYGRSSPASMTLYRPLRSPRASPDPSHDRATERRTSMARGGPADQADRAPRRLRSSTESRGHPSDLACVVELRGIEPLTSSMPWKRSTN
jgi:hypothetical protein